MRLLKQKLSHRDQGFTLMEAMVGMTIVTAIIGVSLQVLLAGNIHRVIAREKAEAITLIESDLESLKFRASQYADKSKCNASMIEVGYAQGFRDADPSVNGLGGDTATVTKKIDTKNVRLTRTTSPRNAPPYNILEIRYRVAATTGSTIATLYTEVIPNAAFQCP